MFFLSTGLLGHFSVETGTLSVEKEIFTSDSTEKSQNASVESVDWEFLLSVESF